MRCYETIKKQKWPLKIATDKERKSQYTFLTKIKRKQKQKIWPKL